MGRLIDEEDLEKYIMHDGCEKGCGYIDERDLKYIQPTEAIPKDQYEARLKADMVAMLEDLDLQIEELFYRQRPFTWDDTGEKGMMDIRPSYDDICFLIQQKINKLKENT